jgi:hypothetical protein
MRLSPRSFTIQPFNTSTICDKKGNLMELILKSDL